MEEGDKVNDSQPPTNIYLQATGRNKTKEETLLHLVMDIHSTLQEEKAVTPQWQEVSTQEANHPLVALPLDQQERFT